MCIGKIHLLGHQNPYDLVRAHELLCPGNLQKAGHENRHIHVSGDFLLKKSKIATLSGDSPAAHSFQFFSSSLDRFQAGRLIFFHHQRFDIDLFSNFELNGKWVGAGISNITGKPRIYIVQNNDA